MGRAFHDKDETCTGDSTDESEDESCTLKDIESEAFTIALNLYYLTKHLPESVSSAVNTNHYHLMTTNALFCFGAMLSKNTASTSTELEELLHSYKFAKVQVAPDGNCLFASVLFQLKQMLSAGNSDLAKHLQVLGLNIMEMRDDKAAIAALRALMVAEMLENKVEYEGYLSNESVEYEQQVREFQKLGVHSGEVGNLMALSLSNVLRINIVLLTSMVNFPVIPVTPRGNVCTDKTLYLAFSHFGSGHYDPVVEDVINAQDNDQPMQSIPSFQKEGAKGCGCGRGASSNKSHPGGRSAKKFCFQEPGERRTLCPCYRAYKACTELCRCFNCCNTIGKRPESSHKKSQVRKRLKHELQNVETNNLTFMQNKGETPVDPKWTKFEHILLEVVFDRLIERIGDATDEDVSKVFNSIASTAESVSEVSLLSRKEEAAVIKKIKSIKQQAELFRQFYLNQVELNFSNV